MAAAQHVPRRCGLVVGIVTFLSLAFPVVPSAAASCPDVKFFGVHGTNEKPPGEDTKFGGAGETIWNIWLTFVNSEDKPLTKSFEAVDFPESRVDFPEAYVWSQATFLAQVAQLDAGANAAATQLVKQMSATNVECGAGTRYLLVGYSQGAWAIDRALRQNLPPGLEAQIAGILLLGDPAWPRNNPYPDREGIAVSHGQARGVTPPYAPSRFANRFVSICVSYPGDVYDPICWFDGNLSHITGQLWAHFSYKDHSDRFVGYLNSFL
jgi:hypothetical protein